MAKLLVLQGLPASGKSTHARKILADSPAGYALRINNDDLSTMMFGSAFSGGSKAPWLLGRLRSDMVRMAFRHGYELVILDSTNLTKKSVDRYRKLAEECQVEFELDNSFLSVKLDECLRRNALRENPVPDSVMVQMASLFYDL
jgi:predicted kinase